MFCRRRRAVTRPRRWKIPRKRYFALCVLVACVLNGFVFFFTDVVFPVSARAASAPQDFGLQPLLPGFQRISAQPPVVAAKPPVNHSHPFDVIASPAADCADDVFLLVYVHSAPANFKRRMVIRQTWGDVTQYGVGVRVVYVMGVDADDAVNDVMRFEADVYGDVVQERFLDSYRNLTYKALAALRWVERSCGRSQFVLKTDDDVLVNLFVVLFRLRAQSAVCSLDPAASASSAAASEPTPRSCRRLILCFVWDNMPAMRDGKWRVAETDWPAAVYPRYCSGSAFVLTTDSVAALHRASFVVPFLWVDDVYVTGLLPAAAGGFAYADIREHYDLAGTGLEERFTGTQWYSHMFSHVPPGNLNRILRVWKEIVRISKRVKNLPFN